MKYACTIGFFDGFHLGHQFLLHQLKDVAAARGVQTLAVTFSRPPLATLQPEIAPRMLTDESEKRDFIADFGIDRCEVLDFTPQMAALTAEEFLRLRLVPMGVRLLLMGYDHRFGSDRRIYSQVCETAAAIGVEVVSAKPLLKDGREISSSEIRSLLARGHVAAAQTLLGRPYMLTGTVVHGRHEGTGMGFPTANLSLRCNEKVIPAGGVYAVRAMLDGRTYGGMMNIGTRPTLKNGADVSLETHLFGFSGEAYGKELKVGFVQRMRDEAEFPSGDALRRQLSLDAEAARKILER